jgi:ketosteroid isomerase-like protein
MLKKFLSTLMLLLSTVGVLSQETISPHLASLVAAERAFAKMGAEKGLREAFLTYFADDGINFQPHPSKTKEVIKRQPAWGSQPILVEWEPAYADVSQAGDLGFTTGPTIMTDQSPQKRPTRYGTYFSIWKKQADGSWKVVLDAGTDGPGGPPPQSTTFTAARSSSWKSPSKIQPDAARAALMNVDRDFLKASSQGLLTVFLNQLDEDARLHRWSHFPIIGKEAIRTFLSARELQLTWQPISSDISQSDDLGYTYGSYEWKYTGANESEKGYYARVWKRDSKGNWKIALETHSPLPPESKETRLNSEGYRLLEEKKTKEAIELFKQVVAEFPNSANAYDSLADAYEADGNKQMAIEFAQKALDTLPKDSSANEEFKKRVKDSATEKLKRLKGSLP